MNRLKEIGAFCLVAIMVYHAITNYEETKEIFLKVLKRNLDKVNAEMENKFIQKYGNTHIENTKNTDKKSNEKQEEKQNKKPNENLQFEGKFLSYENKDGIIIAKIKRYDDQSIEYMKTTEEEIKKENYKISNGIDFIFSCGYRNEKYLEECSMY